MTDLEIYFNLVNTFIQATYITFTTATIPLEKLLLSALLKGRLVIRHGSDHLGLKQQPSCL